MPNQNREAVLVIEVCATRKLQGERRPAWMTVAGIFLGVLRSKAPRSKIATDGDFGPAQGIEAEILFAAVRQKDWSG
jgi:hypothetical protein